MAHGDRGVQPPKVHRKSQDKVPKHPRRSKRVLGLKPVRYHKILNLTTTILGMLFLPTHVTASPNIPPKPPIASPTLASNSTYDKPLSPMLITKKLEKLRAYHAICDKYNMVKSPENHWIMFGKLLGSLEHI